MRRTVATLLVVASPLLMVAPVGAHEGRIAAPAAAPAAPEVAVVTPAAPAPVALTPPAVPAPSTVVTPAVPTPSARPAPLIRRSTRTVRAQAPATDGLSDAAYAARLQAELCMARQIFCGLDRSGRYPAG